MTNRFVENETVSTFLLTVITGPTPDSIPNMLVRRNRPKFQDSLHWHNGKHPQSLLCRYTVAWQVRSWRISYLFFQFYE